MASIFQAKLCEVCQRPTVAVVKTDRDWVSVCMVHAAGALAAMKRKVEAK